MEHRRVRDQRLRTRQGLVEEDPIRDTHLRQGASMRGGGPGAATVRALPHGWKPTPAKGIPTTV